MIKIISELKQNEQLYKAVMERLNAIPDSINWLCRYSFGELVKTKNYLSEYEMRFTPEQHRFFMARFNEAESNILQQLMKSSGDDVLKRIESRVKVSTEKTKRYVESIIEQLNNEAELNRLIEDKKKEQKRLNTKSSMELDYQKLQSIFQ